MHLRASHIIERLCKGHEKCSQCDGQLEAVMECIVMNECGHMIHEKCFRELQDLQQYSCRACGSDVRMSFILNQPHVVQIQRFGGHLLKQRRSDIEVRLQENFRKRLDRVIDLEEQLKAKEREILKLKDFISEINQERIEKDINKKFEGDRQSTRNADQKKAVEHRDNQKEEAKIQKSPFSSQGFEQSIQHHEEEQEEEDQGNFLQQGQAQQFSFGPNLNSQDSDDFICDKTDKKINLQAMKTILYTNTNHMDIKTDCAPSYSLYKARRIADRKLLVDAQNFNYQSPIKQQTPQNYATITTATTKTSGKRNTIKKSAQNLSSGQEEPSIEKESGSTILNNSSEGNSDLRQEDSGSAEKNNKKNNKLSLWTAENRNQALAAAKQRLTFPGPPSGSKSSKNNSNSCSQEEQTMPLLQSFPLPKDLISSQKKRQSQDNPADLPSSWIKLPKFLTKNQ